jgi:hypothetical protein
MSNILSNAVESALKLVLTAQRKLKDHRRVASVLRWPLRSARNCAGTVGEREDKGALATMTQGQNPLARIQKLSIHLPPAGTVCKSEYLPWRTKLTPLMIAVNGSMQMNSRVSSGPGAAR